MTTICLNCHVPLVPGTGFCGTCGTPAGQRGTSAQVPPPHMPMPPGFAGGVSATVPVSVGTGETGAQTVAAALGAAGASVTGMAPNAVAFTAMRSSKRTLGFKARFRGIAQVVPGGVTLRVKLEPSSIVPVCIVLTIVLLAGLAYSNLQDGVGGQGMDAGDDAGYALGKFLGPVLMGVLLPYFLISRGSARAVLDQMTRALGAAGVPNAPPYAQPSPAPVTPPPSVTDRVFEQLRELGALREQGILTVAEFDQARAALLAKIA